MADQPKRVKGRFAPGVSGNPGGKPKMDAADKPKRVVRSDGWVNFFTGHGVYGQDKRQGTSFQRTLLSFDQLEQIWLGDDLVARAVETLPKEALREGYDIVISEGEDDDSKQGGGDGKSSGDESELIQQVMDKLRDLGADEAIRKGLYAERGLGGGAVMLGANDGQADLTKPLNMDRVRSLDYLTPLEPRQIQPIYGYSDPQAPKYGQPEIYRITARTYLPPKGGIYGTQTMDIHESRLLVFPGIRISPFQNTSQSGGWGDSVIIRLWRVLRDFNLAWGSAGVLVSEFGAPVFKLKDLWETLSAADGAAAFADRLASMNLAKSTINATVIDAEDDFKREQTPVAGLSDLLNQFATRVAAAADMPLTLLFGTSPGGLNATGDSDIRFFYDRVASFQKEKIEPHLKKLIQLVFRSLKKQEPEKWSINFRPLWQESAQDRAQAMLTQAQADHIWITDGVISAEEASDSHWGSGEWNPEIKVDFDARDRQEQATSGPVKQEDLDILNPDSPKYAPSKLDPAHPDYIAPPPDPNQQPFGGKGGGKGGPPTRGKKPAPPAKKPPQKRTDVLRFDYSDDQPRAEDGKWTSAGGTSAKFSQNGDKTRVKVEHPVTGESAHKEFKTQAGAENFARGFAEEQDAKAAFHAPSAKMLLEASAESEAAGRGAGFTYSPADGKFKTAGYSVSIHPEYETKIHGKALDEKSIEDYLAPKEEFFKDHPAAHIGGWYNPDNDTWYLDVAHVTQNKQEAVGLGAKYKQEGIYDLKEGRTIYNTEYGEIAAGDRGDSAAWLRQDRHGSSQDVGEGDRGRHAGDPYVGAPQARSAGRLDHIEQRNGRWVVLSQDRSKTLGSYATKGEAETRLRQVEHFKNDYSDDQPRGADGKWTGGSADLPLEDNARWFSAKSEGERQRLLLEGNIGIPRSAMPQIDDKDTPAFLQSLKEKGVHVHPHEMVLAASLKPTQNEMNMAKVESMAKDWKPALAKPILISNDGHILDGHHRWAAQVGSNPFAVIPVRRIDMPIRQLVAAANAFPATHHENVQVVKDRADRFHTDYSENQARDERGRWSSEGGLSGIPSGKGDETSTRTPHWKGEAEGKRDTEEAYKHNGKWDASRLDEHLKYVHAVTDHVETPKGPQTVYMTGGGPASGKTSAILTNPESGFPASGIGQKGAAYINPDDAKEFLPEMTAGKAAGDFGAAGFVHNESLHMSRLAMARAIARGQDVVYDSTGDGTLPALTEKINGLRARGVKRIVADYATIDPDEAIRRSDKRSSETGRHVPHDVIRGIHTLVSRTATQAIKNGLFDEAKVWDNSGSKPTLVASYDRAGGLKIHDQANWDAFVKRGNAPLPPGWE